MDKQRKGRHHAGKPSPREMLPQGLLSRGKTLLRGSQGEKPRWATTRKEMKSPTPPFIACTCGITNLITADIIGHISLLSASHIYNLAVCKNL